MQVVCRKTRGNPELQCCVCGQGFVVFWERETAAARAVTRCEIQETLRRQHWHVLGPEAHPQEMFSVPEWEGPPMAGTTVSLQPPVWDL